MKGTLAWKPAGQGKPGGLARLLSCIRLDEVCVLQGAPLFGAVLAPGPLTAERLAAIAILVLGNLFLMAHVFVFNDWSGIEGDVSDPQRAPRTFRARGESAARIGLLAAALLALSLLVFGMLGGAVLALALVIAVLSLVYSVPRLHGKGIPVVNSALHLLGGSAHFLLGYAAVAPVTWQGVAVGAHFGIVFAAGHLTHEARDHDGDRSNGIRTNAVAFGPRRAFAASLVLFTLAYWLLALLALAGLVPRILVFAPLLWLVHLAFAWQAYRRGLGFVSLALLQARYRQIHAVIGVAMLASVVLRAGP